MKGIAVKQRKEGKEEMKKYFTRQTRNGNYNLFNYYIDRMTERHNESDVIRFRNMLYFQLLSTSLAVAYSAQFLYSVAVHMSGPSTAAPGLMAFSVVRLTVTLLQWT